MIRKGFWLIESIHSSHYSNRPGLLHLNLRGIAAYGTWMASSFLHTSSLHKCFVALLACLPLVLPFSSIPYSYQEHLVRLDLLKASSGSYLMETVNNVMYTAGGWGCTFHRWCIVYIFFAHGRKMKSIISLTEGVLQFALLSGVHRQWNDTDKSGSPALVIELWIYIVYLLLDYPNCLKSWDANYVSVYHQLYLQRSHVPVMFTWSPAKPASALTISGDGDKLHQSAF